MANGKTPETPDHSDEQVENTTGSAPRGHDLGSPAKELEERLRKLEGHLTAKGVGKKATEEHDRGMQNASVRHAIKLSSEFIAGILVGALLGWFIDRVAGSSPWGLIIFLFLGFGAGVLNVLRSAGYVADEGANAAKQQRDKK